MTIDGMCITYFKEDHFPYSLESVEEIKLSKRDKFKFSLAKTLKRRIDTPCLW